MTDAPDTDDGCTATDLPDGLDAERLLNLLDADRSTSLGVPAEQGPPGQGPLYRKLSPHTDDLEAAAEAADNPEREAVLDALAALSRGEQVPPAMRRRVQEFLER